ncbi:S-adenosyl-L-methionine-dependent methyltransferase [Trametes versicolor FP-101664 SS1]|uniref:S-adenosyl-L-methionine-dependent methyltransferase n=1 Tax=Trametes versicolor (strain FP-101664) TaxID=717944 RepID=UPI00046234FD|nr:S-adenosyl-L-methionine-dependent methyltransferase [Trametes versicolor FP-101664 SS1]EIW57544.1 S-adenosyl-L-methionine-dependent methyltransferase [Trametes versicolor FP-101664 SS1]
MSSTDLPPSKLGTKQHWDEVYSSELANFADIGDEGEVWFGEDSVEKMVDWALENVPTDPAPYILEVGAGNGNLLFALCDAGYAPHKICGVDYSADAINLAQAIAKARAVQPSAEDAGDDEEDAGGGPAGADKITFATCDFLQDEVARLSGMGAESDSDVAVWDFVLDKGTFDAIALAEKDEAGKAPADGYPARIGRVVKPGGYFLITSCNFTEAELEGKFANGETGLEYHSRIAWPTFSFGGHSGNVYSSVAFRKP